MIEKIEHWYLSEGRGVSYDSEELSILNLVGKTSKKVNETIDFVNETVKNIDDQKLEENVLNVKSPPVSSKLKGAKGDGVSDDTEVIQFCINFLYENGGGVLYFPKGTYMVKGLALQDYVTLEGSGKNSTSIKLISASNEHVISAGLFDVYANGVHKSTPVGCKSGGIFRMSIDGNKTQQSIPHHGLAYYGIDLQLEDVEFKNASGINLYTESPGATYSSVVGQNLQYSIRHIECHDGVMGNFFYNGQSDSTLIDIMCYETTIGAGAFNFKAGSKAMGARIIGLHCWGNSDYGIINEASTCGFTHCHVESATIAKVYIKAATYFDGRVYQAGSGAGIPTDAPAFLIASGIANNNIRTTISNCDFAIKFEGSDGGNCLFDIQMYSATTNPTLFSSTPSRTHFIRARLTGTNTESYFQTPNQRVTDSTTTNEEFYSNNVGFSFFTDKSVSERQFGIERTVSPSNYVAVAGGSGIAGPSLISRGSETDIDLKLVPKGSGRVRFGTHVTNADTAITGYIEIKDTGGIVRKVAIIG